MLIPIKMPLKRSVMAWISECLPWWYWYYILFLYPLFHLLFHPFEPIETIWGAVLIDAKLCSLKLIIQLVSRDLFPFVPIAPFLYPLKISDSLSLNMSVLVSGGYLRSSNLLPLNFKWIRLMMIMNCLF